MQSQDEFLKSHKQRYDAEGLPRAERLRRYEQYASSSAGVSKRARPSRSAGVPAAFHSRPEDRKQFRSASVPARRYGTSAGSMRSAFEGALSNNPLLRAMLDPFDLKAMGGGVPRIPDGEFAMTSTVRLRDERDVQVSALGGFCIFVRASPWAAISASNANSQSLTGASVTYQSAVEYNAQAANAGRASAGLLVPPWAVNCWSVTVPNVNDTVSRANGYAPSDFPNAAALYGCSAAWRPVCMGVKIKYAGKPIQASGMVAVARWPATFKAPTTSNFFLDMQGETETIPQLAENAGPTFSSVQNLPQGEIIPAPQGLTAVWAPDSLSAQKRWRPVKPYPITGSDGAGLDGATMVSNTAVSGSYTLPPPVTGDPARAQALIDRIYTTNSMTTPDPSLPAGTEGLGNTAAFVYTSGLTAALLNSETATMLQNRLNDLFTTDMCDGDNGIIIVGEGLDPTAILTVETVLGVEYIPDSRAIIFGGGPSAATVMTKPSQQQSEHAAAVLVAKEAPAAIAGDGKSSDFLGSVVNAIEGGAEMGGKLASGAERLFTTFGPIVESLAAMFV